MDKLAARTGSSATTVTDDAMAALESYRWPGNVRELENVIEHALVFAEGEAITIEDLPPMLGGGHSDAGAVSLARVERQGLAETLEEIERRLICQAYEKAGGVKTETARLLGIKPSALYYKLEKYEIDDAQ